MMCNNIIFSEYPTCRDIYINMLHAFTHTHAYVYIYIRMRILYKNIKFIFNMKCIT